MTLNHINLTVSAPVEAQAFFVKHLGLTAKGKGNKNMAVLRDDNGMSVLLMSPSMGGDTTIGYPSTFHIGFMQDTVEQVNQINRALKDAGYDLPEPSKQHGSWTFYFETPWGITIEVGA